MDHTDAGAGGCLIRIIHENCPLVQDELFVILTSKDTASVYVVVPNKLAQPLIR